MRLLTHPSISPNVCVQLTYHPKLITNTFRRYSTNIILPTAPNVYKIPTVLGISKEGPIRSAPAFTMAGRQKPRLIPALLLPGPGAYDAEYSVMKYKPPMYTMRGKFKYPSDEHNKPGPGAHCPEKVNNSHIIYNHIFSYSYWHTCIFI